MKVNICGHIHDVQYKEDCFDFETHYGMIDYKNCTITVNKDCPQNIQEETLCHEMVHGMLFHLGYQQYSQDETFVQALANAIYQGFKIRDIHGAIGKE